jgi:hypothetical protein
MEIALVSKLCVKKGDEVKDFETEYFKSFV